MGSRSRHPFGMIGRRTPFFDLGTAGSYTVLLDRDGFHVKCLSPTKPEPPYTKWAKEDLLRVPRNRRLRKYGRPAQDKYKNKREPWRRPPRKLTLAQQPGRRGYRGRRVRRRL